MNLSFTVYGRPQQMGSKRAFVRGKRAILTDDNSKSRKQWANAVATAAAEAMNGDHLTVDPVEVSIQFFFARPKSHYGTGRNSQKLKPSAPIEHSQSPDIDKLIRNVLDSMTGIVYRDDKQVCCLRSWREWTESQEGAVVKVSSRKGTP